MKFVIQVREQKIHFNNTLMKTIGANQTKANFFKTEFYSSHYCILHGLSSSLLNCKKEQFFLLPF